MSISGVLEDLPLGDVLQFVHLGGRTGTLYLWQDEDRRAEIGFHGGRIVSAWAPGQQRLGDLLRDRGLLDDHALEAALLHQRGLAGGASLGRVLIERGTVSRQEVHQVVKEQIQLTILELVGWQQGHFHFEVDELNPVDDFALAPGDLLDDADLNTQMLLLEAARRFDEEQRDAAAVAPPVAPASHLERHLRRAGLAGRGDGGPARRNGERPRATEPVAVRCQVASDDAEIVAALRAALPEELVRVTAVRLRDAGSRLPGEPAAPIVVVDLVRGEGNVDDLVTLARTRPGAAIVAVAAESQMAAAYAAGAVSVTLPDPAMVVAACGNLLRYARQPQTVAGGLGAGGFRRFRRVVFDVQSGLLSATMALNLLHVISESVERAVLFLVQRGRLRAVGAFGFSGAGRPLAEATRGYTCEPAEGSVFRRAMEGPEPTSVAFDDLDSRFAALLGAPQSGQVVFFPVLGAERTIALIYTDNGESTDEIQDIRILELATAQVGVAFENELLRSQLEGEGLEVVLE